MQHAYDFYKPNMSSEYPVVDGKLSVKCYFRAVDHCYQRYKDRLAKKENKDPANIKDIDYLAFHTPFCKIVQKCVARMVLADFLAEQEPDLSTNGCYHNLSQYR
jgi:hydroxymethylglutaryl-CoA synthase